MVKKNNQEIKQQLTPAYKGSVSTVIITVFILGFGWFFPLIIADNLEKVRRGERLWFPDITHEEFLIWSIESNTDFNSVEIRARGDDGYYNGKHQWGKTSSRSSSFGVEHLMASTWKDNNLDKDFNNYWLYRTRLTNSQRRYKMVYNDIAYAYTDTTFGGSNNVEGKYMVGNLIDDIPLGSGYNPQSQPLIHWSYASFKDAHSGHRSSEQLHYWCKFDLDEWVDNEATTLTTYIEFEGDYDYCRFIVDVVSQNTGNGRRIDSQVIAVNPSQTIKISTESEITVDDFIAIQNLQSDGDLSLRLRYYGVYSSGSEDITRGMRRTDPQVIFDASVYGLLTIEEERPTTLISSLDKFSIYMILQSLGLIVIGLAMLPQFTMGGIFRKLGVLGKKK